MTIGPQLAVTEDGGAASSRAVSALAGPVVSAARRGGMAAAAGLAWRSGWGERAGFGKWAWRAFLFF
jgi:hypothetical protein